MPAMPPLRNGSVARTAGLWRKSVVAAWGSDMVTMVGVTVAMAVNGFLLAEVALLL